jgi:hypothetical protein
MIIHASSASLSRCGLARRIAAAGGPPARGTRDGGTAVPSLSFAPRQIGICGGCADVDGGGSGLPNAGLESVGHRGSPLHLKRNHAAAAGSAFDADLVLARVAVLRFAPSQPCRRRGRRAGAAARPAVARSRCGGRVDSHRPLSAVTFDRGKSGAGGVPSAGAADSPLPCGSSARPTDSGCRADHRRRRRIVSTGAGGPDFPRREAGGANRPARRGQCRAHTGCAAAARYFTVGYVMPSCSRYVLYRDGS